MVGVVRIDGVVGVVGMDDVVGRVGGIGVVGVVDGVVIFLEILVGVSIDVGDGGVLGGGDVCGEIGSLSDDGILVIGGKNGVVVRVGGGGCMASTQASWTSSKYPLMVGCCSGTDDHGGWLQSDWNKLLVLDYSTWCFFGVLENQL